MKVRLKKGQQAEASLGILDSQSVGWGNNRRLPWRRWKQKSKRTPCSR